MKSKTVKKTTVKKNTKKSIPKLKIYLMEKGITQEYLRDATKLSRHCVVKIINGKGKTNDSSKLLISKVLGITWEKMQDLLKPIDSVK